MCCPYFVKTASNSKKAQLHFNIKFTSDINDDPGKSRDQGVTTRTQTGIPAAIGEYMVTACEHGFGQIAKLI